MASLVERFVWEPHHGERVFLNKGSFVKNEAKRGTERLTYPILFL